VIAVAQQPLARDRGQGIAAVSGLQISGRGKREEELLGRVRVGPAALGDLARGGIARRERVEDAELVPAMTTRARV
jgi:hypothetical protein